MRESYQDTFSEGHRRLYHLPWSLFHCDVTFLEEKHSLSPWSVNIQHAFSEFKVQTIINLLLYVVLFVTEIYRVQCIIHSSNNNTKLHELELEDSPWCPCGWRLWDCQRQDELSQERHQGRVDQKDELKEARWDSRGMFAGQSHVV